MPEARGQGLGREMISLLLDEVKKRQIHLVRLDATKTALTFYLSLGFKPLEQSFVQMSDQKIDCTKMILEFTKGL